MKRAAMVLNPRDNVAVALRDLKVGEEVEVTSGGEVLVVQLLSDVPFGHKFALAEIKKGEQVIKYGEVIGIATRDIKRGEHVHVHNVRSARL
ncbi:MAG: UxaA family hydrolase [Candidatus Verstraetearchaeota archaeon]|nr:UxaA family hydrolase [Candidatus Verstraetearchaeota archaeon]